MPAGKLIALIVVFFVTSVVSVVTGSTSLITVPVMISFGMEAHEAIATNMLALTFMSVGGALPFLRKKIVSRDRLAAFIVLTLAGSALGAALMLRVPITALQIIIACAMVAVALFSIFHPEQGREAQGRVSTMASGVGFMVTFLLAIYGGFFSGGYVTMLTAAFVVLLGMNFLEAIATTKVINLFSSAVATAIFAARGVVDWRLGIVLGASMFVGAMLGARITLLLSAAWVRRIFLLAVFALALKMLASAL
ncbi:MAG TPA: sulfite exporter TauE/SafE family protein [Terriglobales bacterium]